MLPDTVFLGFLFSRKTHLTCLIMIFPGADHEFFNIRIKEKCM
jgi:hypothetical protein